MRLSSITELSAAALAILATPAAARPFSKTLSPCLLKVAEDVPCVDPLAFHYLLAVGSKSFDTLWADLEQFGCAPIDALTSTLAAKQCLVEMNQALPKGSASDPGPGPEDLRRRDVISDEPQPQPQPQPQPRQPVRARGARLMARATTFNVTVSSAIVGSALGVTGAVAFIGVCFSCLRERSQKKKARVAAEAKAAAKEAARAAAKAKGRQ